MHRIFQYHIHYHNVSIPPSMSSGPSLFLLFDPNFEPNLQFLLPLTMHYSFLCSFILDIWENQFCIFSSSDCFTHHDLSGFTYVLVNFIFLIAELYSTVVYRTHFLYPLICHWENWDVYRSWLLWTINEEGHNFDFDVVFWSVGIDAKKQNCYVL